MNTYRNGNFKAVCLMLIVVIPVVQMMTIREAHAQVQSTIAYNGGRALLRLVPPLVAETSSSTGLAVAGTAAGGVLLWAAVGGVMVTCLYKSGAVQAVLDWWYANFATNGGGAWSVPGTNITFQVAVTDLSWDPTDSHYHCAGAIKMFDPPTWTGQNWQMVTTVAAPTEAGALRNMNENAQTIIRGYYSNAVRTPGVGFKSGASTDKSIPMIPPSGQYTSWPAFPDNSVFVSPGDAYQYIYNTPSAGGVIMNGLGPGRENDLIKQRQLTNYDFNTGTQAASAIDNAAAIDLMNNTNDRATQEALQRQTDAINQGAADTVAAIQAIPSQLADAMEPTNSISARWATVWATMSGKFPFSVVAATAVPISSTNETTLSYPGYQLAPGCATTPPLEPLGHFGGLGNKVREGAGYLVYAATVLFIIRRVATL